LLEEHESLQTIQGTVARLIIDEGAQVVVGIETLEGRRFGAATVVITTGTFLRGRIHIGTDTKIAGGARRGVVRDSSGGAIRPTRVGG
jgi:tRNA uridine 5-carboxymethylaminomethyl modification enzyme